MDTGQTNTDKETSFCDPCFLLRPSLTGLGPKVDADLALLLRRIKGVPPDLLETAARGRLREDPGINLETKEHLPAIKEHLGTKEHHLGTKENHLAKRERRRGRMKVMRKKEDKRGMRKRNILKQRKVKQKERKGVDLEMEKVGRKRRISPKKTKEKRGRGGEKRKGKRRSARRGKEKTMEEGERGKAERRGISRSLALYRLRMLIMTPGLSLRRVPQPQMSTT